MPSPRILVFIPMFNCERQIGRVLAQLTPEVQALLAEVLVVDNRSVDGSRDRAAAALRGIEHCRATLWMNDANYSLGGSHKVAFLYALEHGMDYVIVLHGDDQASIADLVPILRAGTHLGYDAMLGSRFARGARRSGYSALRTAGNVALNALCSLATGCWITDMGAGLNLYSRRFLEDRTYLRFPNDLTFNVYLLFHGVASRTTFTFFPLTWREADQVSNARVFRQGRRILGLIFDYCFRPARLPGDAENDASRQAYTGRVLAQVGPDGS